MNNNLKRKMIAGIVGGFMVVSAAVLIPNSIVIIKPGYEGIVYSMNGGIQEKTLTKGLNFKLPFFHKVRQYSVATEQGYLSVDEREGSKENDSFKVTSKDGQVLDCDLEFSYHFDSESLTKTFIKFRGAEGKSIESNYMRGKLKTWTQEAVSQFSAMEIRSEKKLEVNKAILVHVEKNFKNEKSGIVIETINLTRNDFVDKNSEKAIQEIVNKQQELKKAEMNKAIAEQDAAAAQIKAESDAKIKEINAQAQAKANDLLGESLKTNPSLVSMKVAEALEKNGFPTYIGDLNGFLNITK